MSWLSIFKNVLHAVEAAASLAAPIIAVVVDKKQADGSGGDGAVIAGLMTQAVTAAVGIESISSALTTPMSGSDKAAVVDSGTKATLDLINSLLVSQGKTALPASVTDIVSATVKTTVQGLQAAQVAVAPETVKK